MTQAKLSFLSGPGHVMLAPLPSLASTELSLHRPVVFDLPRKKPLETQLGARRSHTMCWSDSGQDSHQIPRGVVSRSTGDRPCTFSIKAAAARGLQSRAREADLTAILIFAPPYFIRSRLFCG